MVQLALTALEKIINRYLQLDPDTVVRVAALRGKAVRIEITDWQVGFYVLPQADGLQLVETIPAEPDTVISGKLFALFNIGLKRADRQSLFANQIAIDGDIETGEALQKILRSIDIDWEEHLSRVFGDQIAVQLSRTSQRTTHGFSRLGATLCDTVTRYLQAEIQLLPTAQDVENYCQNVGELRDDTERLSARIALLTAKDDDSASC